MRIVIYKANGVYKTTNENNYNARVQDARLIHTMDGFKSAEEIKEYFKKYSKCKEDDFIVVE